MARFIMGALFGLAIGMLAGSYFASHSLDDFTNMARAGLSRYVPVHN